MIEVFLDDKLNYLFAVTDKITYLIIKKLFNNKINNNKIKYSITARTYLIIN